MVYSGYRANRQEGTAMADVYKQSFKQNYTNNIEQIGRASCRERVSSPV